MGYLGNVPLANENLRKFIWLSANFILSSESWIQDEKKVPFAGSLRYLNLELKTQSFRVPFFDTPNRHTTDDSWIVISIVYISKGGIFFWYPKCLIFLSQNTCVWGIFFWYPETGQRALIFRTKKSSKYGWRNLAQITTEFPRIVICQGYFSQVPHRVVELGYPKFLGSNDWGLLNLS